MKDLYAKVLTMRAGEKIPLEESYVLEMTGDCYKVQNEFECYQFYNLIDLLDFLKID